MLESPRNDVREAAKNLARNGDELSKGMIQHTTLPLAVNRSDVRSVLRQGLVERSEELAYDMFVMSREFNVFPRRLP